MAVDREVHFLQLLFGIEKEGVRHALKKVAGLEVVWRSPEFKVD